jgi:outer membrane protein insertion porin family
VIARRVRGAAAVPAAGLAIACALASAIAASPARADTPPELSGRPITDVEIEGVAGGASAADLGIAPGAILDRRTIRAAILRMLASGRWADVQIDAEARPGGVVLVLRLAPRILLTRIELRGNEAMSDDSLRQAMRVREGAEIETGGLVDLQQAALDAYAERGYARAELDVQLRDTDDPSRKVLLVDVREGTPTRLRAIEWSGARRPPDQAGLDALGLGVGDVLDRRRLDEGVLAVQARLRALGWLEARLSEPTLRPVEDGVVLVLPIELGRHWRVVIRGYAPLERADVEAVLGLADEPLSEAVEDTIRDRVIDLYGRHGFHAPRVAVERTRDPDRPDDPRAARLSIDIEAGVQLRVIALSFPGATHFGQSFLRDQVVSFLEEDLPTADFFSPVDSEVADRIGLGGRATAHQRQVPADVEVIADRIWHQPTYAEAVAHIEELYEAAGFLDARVTPAELYEIDHEHALVRINVFEGPRTLVYDVRIRGNELLPAHSLLDAAHLVRGDAFGYLPLEEASRRILALYRERGHLFARVEPVVRFSPDRERAEIVFDVIERFPVTVGEIRVEGNTSTDTGMILDVMSLSPGDVYRPSAARESEERLLALGIFQSVQIAPADPDHPERVKPLVVTVSERNSQAVGLSAGLGTGEGARGTLEWQWRNIGGIGVTFSFRFQLGYQFFFQDDELEEAITSLQLGDRLERRISAGIQIPWIPGLPAVRASLDYTHIRDNERDFGYDKNGVSLSFTWQPERRLTFTVAGEVEQNSVGLLGNVGTLRELIEAAIMRGDTRTQRLLRVPEGETALGSARLQWSWDLRDSPFTPTEGAYMAITSEYAHSLDSIDPMQPGFLSNFLKLNATLSGYIPIAEGWVLALQARAGVIIHMEAASDTYPNRAYYLGGVDSLRGFLQDQVIPQDQAELILEQNLNPAAIVRTGDIYYLARVELRFPIVGVVQGGIFADIGNVWAFVHSFDLFVPRWNAGIGLRIATPVGPIALDYGFLLDRRPALGEPEIGSLHFSIGLF